MLRLERNKEETMMLSHTQGLRERERERERGASSVARAVSKRARAGSKPYLCCQTVREREWVRVSEREEPGTPCEVDAGAAKEPY